jgi:Acyl-CoA carboxylase epsilon subunit
VDKDLAAKRAVPAADDSRASAPYLRVVHGNATAEEIAALVGALTAVAAARAAAAQPEPARPVSGWTDRSRLLRPPVHPSPGGWRQSALPR